MSPSSKDTVLGGTPLRVYGSRISYYTGKFEGYLRYKEIPYELIDITVPIRLRLIRRTGAAQMPAVELPDGRFMTDTTPMIDWFEERWPDPPVIPADPLLRFFSKLVEDYAEEWLWRPAMHYRWSYAPDRKKLGQEIADEMLGHVPMPRFAKYALIRRRQHHYFVQRDGVDRTTWDHVESVYLRNLEWLSTIFEARPFLLGDRPTLADFGFFASMFRHFSQDPTPSAIMRERAPAVFDWQARLWEARASAVNGPLLDHVPDDWSPILEHIGAAYLPYLNDNARAFAAGRERIDLSIEAVSYSDVPVSQYRVWCLHKLRQHFHALDDDTAAAARAILEAHGAWQPLWETDVDARYDESQVPFRGQKVHYRNHFP